MRTWQVLAALAIVVLLAIPVLADLPCQPAPVSPLPLTVGAFLEQILGSLLQSGIAVLFVAALAVVGVPWLMAGLAMGLVQIARRRY